MSKVLGGILVAMVGVAIIVIFAVSSLFGGIFGHTEDKTVYEDYSVREENVTSISIDVDAGEFEIVEGTEFLLVAENVPEGGFEASMENGIWTIKCKNLKTKTSYLTIFNWEIPIRYRKGNFNGNEPKLKLTIPKDFNANFVNIALGAGKITGKRLSAATVDFNIGAGQCEFDYLDVADSGRFCVGAGDLTVEDVNGNDLHIDAGVGNVDLSGCITGNSKVKCGVGRVAMKLTEPESEYHYIVNCDLGSVRVGNNETVSSKSSSFGNINSENSFHLDCAVGRIEIDFL